MIAFSAILTFTNDDHIFTKIVFYIKYTLLKNQQMRYSSLITELPLEVTERRRK